VVGCCECGNEYVEFVRIAKCWFSWHNVLHLTQAKRPIGRPVCRLAYWILENRLWMWTGLKWLYTTCHTKYML